MTRIPPLTKPFVRELYLPPDKSLTHRAVMFNAAAEGRAVVRNASKAQDCLATEACMRALGAAVERKGNDLYITGLPPEKLRERWAGKTAELYAGNSGTTLRLLCGLLAGAGVGAELRGDKSLSMRPTDRVTGPLKSMGAAVSDTGGRPPVSIRPAALSGIDYTLITASAQGKSAVILAALNARGETVVHEPVPVRNHTENLLLAMGAQLSVAGEGTGNVIRILPSTPAARDFLLGGDMSAAAYWLTLAAVVPDSKVRLLDVNINPTRTGIITFLKNIGADVSMKKTREDAGEPYGEVMLRYSGRLSPFNIGAAEVPGLIDELPLAGLLACFADGESSVRGAGELRVKESDRISATCRLLSAFGAEVTEHPDGFTIKGRGGLGNPGASVKTGGDHRIAMTAAIAGLAAGGCRMDDLSCAEISYPGFERLLSEISSEV